MDFYHAVGLELADKIKKNFLEMKIYFFSYFLENYSRRVRISTNKKILALVKEPLCIFGSLETVLPGSWQSIKGATCKIALHVF